MLIKHDEIKDFMMQMTMPFNVKEDKKVLRIFRRFFTKRKVIAVDCSDLIWGFGAIHCMTQQEPII